MKDLIERFPAQNGHKHRQLQVENYLRFGESELIDESDLIPASRALICWAHNTEHGTTDVLVTWFPNDREYFDEYWDGTHGACCSDWLNPGNRTMTPESVFAEIAAFYGFANCLVAEKTIMMFARIQECEWARKMIATDSYDRLRKAGLTERW